VEGFETVCWFVDDRATQTGNVAVEHPRGGRKGQLA